MNSYARCSVCLNMMVIPEGFLEDQRKDWPQVCEDC